MQTLLDKAARIAQQLNAKKVDVNEVEKLLAYARQAQEVENVREMMRRLATQNVIIYSNRTKGYVKTIQQVVAPALPRDIKATQQLLGWVARFMRYERAKRRRR